MTPQQRDAALILESKFYKSLFLIGQLIIVCFVLVATFAPDHILSVFSFDFAAYREADRIMQFTDVEVNHDRFVAVSVVPVVCAIALSAFLIMGMIFSNSIRSVVFSRSHRRDLLMFVGVVVFCLFPLFNYNTGGRTDLRNTKSYVFGAGFYYFILVLFTCGLFYQFVLLLARGMHSAEDNFE